MHDNICGSVLSPCKSEFAPICHNVTKDWRVKWTPCHYKTVFRLETLGPSCGCHLTCTANINTIGDQVSPHLWQRHYLMAAGPPSGTMRPAKLTTNISVLVQGPWQRAKAVNMASKFPRSQSDWASAGASPIPGGPISRPKGLKGHASNTLVPDNREHTQLWRIWTNSDPLWGLNGLDLFRPVPLTPLSTKAVQCRFGAVPVLKPVLHASTATDVPHSQDNWFKSDINTLLACRQAYPGATLV